MRWLLILLLMFAICATNANSASLVSSPQNVTEHSWIYSQGYIDDMRIYQTEAGFYGQKLVTGTTGSGTVSRTIHSQVYGGYGNDELSFNEWGSWQNKPYTPPLTQSDLRNALCAKNYAVGSVYSESYTDIRDLVKDTGAIQTDQVSVYDIHSEIQGTAKIGARVQKSASSNPAYIMGGTYVGNTNMWMTIEAGNASVLTLPCP
ncbi:MAG: hypothetical protein ACE14P_11575 [Methanotrichaceae archaeon]